MGWLSLLNAAEAGAKVPSKPGKLLAKHKGKKAEPSGLLGWMLTKYHVARHAAHGTFNRVMKVGGNSPAIEVVCAGTAIALTAGTAM